MGKKRKAGKGEVAPSVSMSRANTVTVDSRWDMVFDEVLVGEGGELSIAGHKFSVQQLQFMTELGQYRENVKEFIRQMREAQSRIKAKVTDVLVNMIWTVDGAPHLVSVVLARDIRIQEDVYGLLVFMQKQLAPGQPGRAILAINPACYVEMKNYLGMERTPSVADVAGMYMMAWTVPAAVADELRKAYRAENVSPASLYFKDNALPGGMQVTDLGSKPKILKTEIPAGKDFKKLSKAARNKLRDRVLAASRKRK